MVMKHTFIFILLTGLLAVMSIFAGTAQAATITAKTDRMNITIDETFNLTFMADGSVDDEPDFSPLKKDFDILSQSQGSNISIINGDYKKTTSYTLTLMAKRAGNLLIPAIAFGKDSSQALALSVGAASTTPGGADADIMVEVKPSRNSTWVQGQVVIDVKLMSALNLRQYDISKPDAGKFDVSVESLGDAKQYQTTRGNRNYLVIEQKFAIYPQQAGKLTLQPFVAQVEAVTQSRNTFDPFGARSKIMRARSNPITISVTDMPAQFNGKTWLPASEVQLVEEWSPSPPVFKVGEPVTRTLNIFADGLTAAQLPPLMGADINGIKQYPDQPVLNNDKSATGIIGGRREKIALIPTRAGSFTLPAIEVSWWNTKTGTTEVARIAEKNIQVLPGSAAPAPANNATLPEESAPAIEQTGDALPAAVITDTTSRKYLWLSVFLATGWLVTGLAWWYSGRQSKPVTKISKKEKRPANAGKSAIKHACENNQAAACKDALINWARQNLSADINNLGDIIAIMNNRQETALAKEIALLNVALYSSRTSSWQGHNLWQALEKISAKNDKSSSDTHSALEPLYR